MKQQHISRNACRQRSFLMLVGLLCGAASILFVVSGASAQYADWKHSGSIYILTTPEGANLPASASVKDFPLLVRLHRDHFPLSERNPRLLPLNFEPQTTGQVRCKAELGGLIKSYYREAA